MLFFLSNNKKINNNRKYISHTINYNIIKIFVITQSATSALNDVGFMLNYPFIKLTNAMNVKPILNISVYDYLWGYDDPLAKLTNIVAPKLITFQKIGLLDRVSKSILISQMMH